MSVDSVSGLASALARIREITGGLAPLRLRPRSTATTSTGSRGASDFAAALSGARTAAAPAAAAAAPRPGR